jgi:hypothetical protein
VKKRTNEPEESFFSQADIEVIEEGEDAGMVMVTIDKPLKGRSRVIYMEEKSVVAALIASKVGGKSMVEAQNENLFIHKD